MQRLQDDYLAAYRSLKLTRDSEGVLVPNFTATTGHSLSRHKIIRSLSMLFIGLHKIERTRS
jgi:hypothetical protein